MLKTLKAIYDPKQGLTFSEPVNLQQPVNVLVTILEPCRLADVPGHADKKAAEQPSLTDLLAMPEADKVDFEPLPLSGKLFHPADLS